MLYNGTILYKALLLDWPVTLCVHLLDLLQPQRTRRAGDDVCVSVCVHAPVPAFLTPALFCPLLISDLLSDFKLKN